jgi:hypothetical protein
MAPPTAFGALALLLLLGARSSDAAGSALPVVPSSWAPLDDYYAFVSAVRDQQPGVIGPFVDFGASVEGRPMRAFCVGVSCPDMFSPPGTTSPPQAPPSLLLTAMHHGREPMGALAALHLVRGLAAGWADGDAGASALLRARRIWVVLCVDPDAYALNLDRGGHGAVRSSQMMARKNRRPGCKKHGFTYQDVGVDLNRNYDFAWDVDNVGSSPDVCAEDYRGPSPFSEPETAAMRDFVLHPVYGANLTVAINWHSYARFINLPYAVEKMPRPPDDVYAALVDLAHGMADASGYGFGHPWTGGLYTCNGEASDWMVSRAGLLAYSPEIGPVIDYEPFHAGMWPAPGLLPSILAEALPLQAYALLATGSFVRVHTKRAEVEAPEGAAACPPSAAGAAGGGGDAACARFRVGLELGNRGTRDSGGAVVVSVVSAQAAKWPTTYVDKQGATLVVESLEALVHASADTAAAAGRCDRDVFPTAASAAGAGSASLRGLRAGEDGEVNAGDRGESALQTSTTSDRVLARIRDELAGIVPHSRTERLDLRSTVVAAAAAEGEGASEAAARRRALADGDGTPGGSPFVSTDVPAWGGSRSVSTAPLARFKKWGADSVRPVLVLPGPPAGAGEAEGWRDGLYGDAHGHIAYVAVSDDTLCTVYGLKRPAGGRTGGTAELEELVTGASGCLPCAAFRQGPAATETPSPSPSPSPSPAGAGGVVPTATATASSAAPSPSRGPGASGSRAPWEVIRFPPNGLGAAGAAGGGDDAASSASAAWPWSVSSGSSASAQLALVCVGLVAGIVGGVWAFRRAGLLPRPRRVVVVVQTGREAGGAGVGVGSGFGSAGSRLASASAVAGVGAANMRIDVEEEEEEEEEGVRR